MLQGNGRSGNPTDSAIPAVEAPWTRLLQHQGDGKVALDQSHTRSESMGADIAREGAVCTPSKEADDVWLVSPMDYDSGFLDRATDRVERIGRPPLAPNVLRTHSEWAQDRLVPAHGLEPRT